MTELSRHTTLCGLLVVLCCVGCGTTKSRTATQQLLLSDAIDQAVAGIDFRPLAGEKVYLDTTYIEEVKGFGFVNAKYIISSLRQQIIAASCMLQDDAEDADFIVEARVGTVGSDGNEIVYGLPASNSLSSAASLMPNAPPIPTIPEISLAKKHAEIGAAKVAVFAYHRETREPVWQSGIARSKSTAQDVWFFGAGPFQKGTIYDGIRFAGQRIAIPSLADHESGRRLPMIKYEEQHMFESPRKESRIASEADDRMAKLLEELPQARPDEWLTPLDDAPSSPLEEETLWR